MGTFGYTDIGAFSGPLDTGSQSVPLIVASAFEAPEDGDVTTITAYLDFNASRNPSCSAFVKCAIYIYDSAGGTHDLVDTTEEIEFTQPGHVPPINEDFVDGWKVFEFASPVSVTGGVDYMLAAWGEMAGTTSDLDYVKYKLDSESGYYTGYKYEAWNGYPDPLTLTDLNNFRMSIYATYTPSGGILVPKRMLMGVGT